jgi:hypothetical protein
MDVPRDQRIYIYKYITAKFRIFRVKFRVCNYISGNGMTNDLAVLDWAAHVGGGGDEIQRESTRRFDQDFSG